MKIRKEPVIIGFTLAGALLVRAEVPPLIPREVLFANPERTLPQLSPEGDQIAWLAPDKNGVQNIWVDSINGSNPQLVTNESHRPIFWYAWAGDSKHLLYLQDNAGDEIDHLFSTDLTSQTIRDLTPFRGVRAQNVLLDPRHRNSFWSPSICAIVTPSICIGSISKPAGSPSKRPIRAMS